MSRLLAVPVTALILAATACVADQPASSTTQTAAPSPQLTAENESRIAADALVIACREVWRDCSAKTFYAVLQGPVTAPAVQAAISARFPGVTFVPPEALEALLGDDRLIDGGRGALLSVRDIRTLASDVVGVAVGVDHWMGVEQFRWTGAGWIPATPRETGITVTTAVS